LNVPAPFDGTAAPDAALFELGLALKRAGYRHVTATPAPHQRVLSRGGSRRPATLADVLG
jgi:hypothetical protein